jgi:hypothetical protein
MKKRLFIISGAFLLCAGPATAEGGHPLTKDALSQLLPGSIVESTGLSGTARRWTNEPDGQFTANASVTGRGRTVNGSGDWHVSDDGKYCVHIEWPNITENWCASVQQAADGKYTVVGDGSSGTLPQTVEITSK